MSLLPFCVCKACRKWETWVSTIGRQEKEAGETNFCASSAKGIIKCSQFVMHNWPRAFRAEGKSCVFLRGPHSLSDPTSSLKAHRQSDRGVARMSFSCKRVKDPLYPQNALSVCAFSFYSTPPSDQLIHIFWFAARRALLTLFSREVVLQLSCGEEWDLNWRAHFAVLQGHL